MISDLKIRCSSLGEIMTESRSKTDPLSETCKAKLVELFVEKKYGRSKQIFNKFIEKGLRAEEDSITILSRRYAQFYIKNPLDYENGYIKGTPDIVTKFHIRDTKTSWDIHTFFKTKELKNKIEKREKTAKQAFKNYYWQVQGYMALADIKKAYIDFCLVDTPENQIQSEIYKLERKADAEGSSEDIEAIRNQFVYEDIPIEDRVITIPVEYNDVDVQSIYARIEQCREWLEENYGDGQSLSAGRV